MGRLSTPESPHRGTNELPAGVMCRRNGHLFKSEIHIGRVGKSAESGHWRATHADGRDVLASSSPRVIDFATRRGAVAALLRDYGITGDASR
jgi:hypothetical protein